MTPEEQEQQETLIKLNNAQRQAVHETEQFGKVTDETAAKLSQLQSSLTNNFKALGNSGISLAKQLNNGAIGASVFNDSIGSLTDVIGNLVGLLPYVGTALKTIVKGASEYTQAVNKQTDALFESYEQMSKIGAAGAGGMQSVYDNLKKLNLGVNELDKFVAIVGENSDTLYKFGQTVGGGLTEFANVANSIQQSDVGRRFMEMGISVDEINNGIASYMKMQTIGGVRQQMSTDQLINASKDYIREIDLLSKVTGQTRKQQEEAMESAMAEERFAAFRTELQLRANMGDEAAKAQLKEVDTLTKSLAKEAPKLRVGVLNLLSGTLDNPEAQKIARGMPTATAALQKGAFKANDILNAMQKDTSRTIGKSGEGFGVALGKLGIFGETFGDFNETVKLANMNVYGTLEERMAAAKVEQQVTDQNTKDANQTRVNNRTARNSLNDLINAGIGPVTTAMKGLSTVTETTITAFEKMANTMGVETRKRESAPAASPRPAGRAVPAVTRPSAAPAAPRAAPAAAPAAPAPAPLRPPGGGSLQQKIIQAESGGRNIPNQSGTGGKATSSAYGVAQITKGTFEDLAKNAQPSSPLYGKTFDDMKNDVDLQHEALNTLTDKNKSILAKAGVSTTDAAMYLAHFLGPYGAVKALKAGDASMLNSAVNQKQIDANPNLQKMSTVGDLKTWADKKMGGGGYKFGGIATGPESGYETTLHGTEAVVPLPNGNSIPVEMQGNSEQMGLMSAQLSRLDDIVRVMQNQLGVSQKLLQYAQ